MRTNSGQRDYRYYQWQRGERLRTILVCAAVTVLLAYFFYRSLWAVIPLGAVGLYLFLDIRRKKVKKARDELAAQFRECILSVVSSLQAGYSVENAFLESEKDMELMYGKFSLIGAELKFVRRGLQINITLEELLADIAVRSGSGDIGEFAQIFALAKRNGGNMTEIIKNSAGQIGKRIELRQEVQVLLGGKQMEFMIMKLMPFGILLYVGMGNPGYFEPLYHNLSGIAVMTGCLAVYSGAYFLGESVMGKIEAQLL